MVKDIASHQPPQRPPLRRARYISAETWSAWKEDVYKRYIVQGQSLDKIMGDWNDRYHFPGTKKQWKDQLGRWQFRKRLNKEDAAYILWLLEEAERDGRKRRVFFNKTEKTKDDVLGYIRKSELVKNREELLEYVDLDEPSPYITWEYADQQEPQTAAEIPHGQPAGVVEQIPGTVADDAGAFSAIEQEGYVNVAPAEAVESIPSESSGEEMSVDGAFGDGQLQNTVKSNASTPSLDVPGPYPEPGTGQLFPAETFSNAMAQKVDPRRLNGLLSNSPLQTNLDSEALSKRVDEMFGKIEAIGGDASSQARVAMFLRHCCAAAIYGGQGFEDQRWNSIAQATDTFREMLFLHPWDTLTTLINLYALMSMYGHRIVIHDILRAVDGAVRHFAETNERPVFTAVVQSVLFFMITIPEPGTKVAYDLEALARMELQARDSFGDHPEFALSASYIMAWVLLEMKRYPDALDKLSGLRAECEEVFDYGQFQTICWIATLARAYAMNGQVKMAANTYRDVAGRIARYFSTSHPQYWDSVYRQACYDRRVIDDFEDPQKRQQGWLNVAETMRRSLRWRAHALGPYNPQTLQNFKALRGVLKKLEKDDETATLEQVIDIDLS